MSKRVLVLMVSPAVRLGGGIIQVILNYKNQLDKVKIDFDYAINIEEDEKLIEDLTANGGKWIQIPHKKRQYLNYLKAIWKLCEQGKYDAIHIHGNSATMLPEVWIAKRCGITKRIVHCHNSQGGHPIVNKLLVMYFRTLYTDALACSKRAGNWLFGEKKFTIIHNAIDLNRFSFSVNYRNSCRKELNISGNCLLLGHVGSFNEQKNHSFLVDIFYDIQKRTDVELILIGTGELLEQIVDKCNRLGILQKVHFLGMRNDVEKWLCAMDVFVFPSKWEGLGMVAIEAQATGLPVLASTEVPQEACLTPYMKFLSLEQNAQFWADSVLEISKLNKSRKVDREMFSDYDISRESKKLQSLYEN